MRRLTDDDYRPTFSGHDTFSLRYGWLQKAYAAVAKADPGEEASRIFRDPASIATFGVGRNMVTAMRYWALHTGVLETGDDGLRCGWVGDLLLGEDSGTDPYLEDHDSLWLLHWHLVAYPGLTAWYWLFSVWEGGEFDRRRLKDKLIELTGRQGWKRVADKTVDRDLQCLLRTYVGARGEADGTDSLLAELGLVRPLGHGRYRIVRDRRPTLGRAVFLYALADFWSRRAPDATTLSFEAVAYESGSPGRVFALATDALIDRLEALETDSGGQFEWSESAGLQQVRLRQALDLPALRRWLAAQLMPHALEVAA